MVVFGPSLVAETATATVHLQLTDCAVTDAVAVASARQCRSLPLNGIDDEHWSPTAARREVRSEEGDGNEVDPFTGLQKSAHDSEEDGRKAHTVAGSKCSSSKAEGRALIGKRVCNSNLADDSAM